MTKHVSKILICIRGGTTTDERVMGNYTYLRIGHASGSRKLGYRGMKTCGHKESELG